MIQRVRYPDPYKPTRIVNQDRELGPGGERRGHAAGSNVGGQPISAVSGRGVDTGYSQTKPGVRIPWR